MADSTAPPPPPPQKLDTRTLFFLYTSVCTVCCFLVFCVPGFTPVLRSVTVLAYRLGFASALAAHAARLYHLFGPKLLQLQQEGGLTKMAAAAAPLSRELLASNSLLYFLYCLLFLLSRHPTNLALLTPAFFALVQAYTTLMKTPRVGGHPKAAVGFKALTEKLGVIQASMATSQIMIGFSMIVALFTGKRELAKTFVYWNLILRGMYHANDAVVLRFKLPMTTGGANKMAWQALGQKVQPLLSAVPAVARITDTAANWFTSQ